MSDGVTKLKVNVYIGTRPVSENYYAFVSKEFDIEPVRIIRKTLGRASRSLNPRIYYMVEFIGTKEMIDCNQNSMLGKVISSRIEEKLNPSWVPPEDGWADNVWIAE